MFLVKIRKGDGVVRIKTVKEPEEKYRCKPYFDIGEKKFLI
jgi:hypothetical protein